MKRGFFRKTRKAVCLLVIASFSTWLPGGAAWAANPPPLSAVPIPTPPNLGDFVKDKAAAVRLGKALFWDMNVGGDGVQACASCHYRAGADPINDGQGHEIRNTNQLNPKTAAPGLFESLGAPNKAVPADKFPFTQVSDPLNARLQDGLLFTSNFDDVMGSQGVSFNLFVSLSGLPLDNGSPQLDPAFGHSRRTTGRNTPPAVNAVFNYANFWDGRANNIFNGSSPLGPLDPFAGIWVNLNAPLDEPVLQFQKIAIPNASLASQAVGPPNNAVEMSWDGRNFPQLGRKLLGLTPLGQQLVSKTDSALGPLSKFPAKGISKGYSQMVQEAFHDKYWDSSAPNIVISGVGYSQMEANFSLFWGLAVMLYEATLVSDLTPFDCFLGNPNPKCTDGTVTPMSQAAIDGWGVFQSKCATCHTGSELSDATVSNALANGLIDIGVTRAGGAISDIGFANLGLRPTAEDIGRGGIGGDPNLIASFSGEALAQANGTLPFLAPQAIFGGIKANTPAAVNGSFKTPVLRNVALTAPYFHTGAVLTLDQLVQFYSRNGNFANAEQANEMQIGGLNGNQVKHDQLVAFLNALTDPRVAAESAPFDHPQLFIPYGTTTGSADLGTDPKIELPVTPELTAAQFAAAQAEIAAILAKPAETATLDTLPKAVIGAPNVNKGGATMTVTVQNGDQYIYNVDAGAQIGPVPATEPLTISGLSDGTHTVTVIGVNSGTGRQQVQATAPSVSMTVDATPPNVTCAEPETMTKTDTQTISGTKEAGSTIAVSVDTGATVGPVTVSGNTWSCQVSGLKKGSNNITITATDAAGNKSSITKNVKILIADGCFSGKGSPDISDALKALRMTVGLVTPTADDYLHGDVNGDKSINSSDAIMILRKVAGLPSF